MNRIDIRRFENQLIHSPQSGNRSQNINKKNFEEVLGRIQNKNEEIKFSKHAKSRIDNRQIGLNSEELQRLKAGFNKAEEKGVSNALILVGDKAFIASIKNKTVITTVNKEQLIDNVFTNIDGAVIV